MAEYSPSVGRNWTYDIQSVMKTSVPVIQTYNNQFKLFGMV